VARNKESIRGKFISCQLGNNWGWGWPRGGPVGVVRGPIRGKRVLADLGEWFRTDLHA